MEAGRAIEQGILNVLPDTEVTVKPLADGGEGTTEALVEGMGGDLVKVAGSWTAGDSGHCGLWNDSENRDSHHGQYGCRCRNYSGGQRQTAAGGYSTYGVGEMIKDAIERGCRKFIIGIGGSATNDGGIGMLTALGYEFLDEDGEPAGIGADALGKVVEIRTARGAAGTERMSFPGCLRCHQSALWRKRRPPTSMVPRKV